MPRARKGNPNAGRPPRNRPPPVEDDSGFGFEDIAPIEAPALLASPPDPALVALGPPPVDAIGIEKWHYRMLSTMAYLVSVDPTITNEVRMRRCAQLASAAAKHYPAAVKYDLAEKIDRDNKEISERKRAKAAARLEPRPPPGAAKVIPIRADG